METNDIELDNPFPISRNDCCSLCNSNAKNDLENYGGMKKLTSNLEVDTLKGISTESIPRRQSQYGRNVYQSMPPKSFLTLWLEAFKELTIIALMIAGTISLILGAIFPEEHEDDKCSKDDKSSFNTGWIEGFAIIMATLAVTLVSAVTNYSKEKKFAALSKKEQDVPVKVLRDGIQQTISINEILVGDIVKLSTGDQIPADGLFVRGHSLKVDESQSTGESEAASKSEDRDIFMFGGTKISSGSGDMLVLAVGSYTEWGKTQAAATASKPRPTPLQVKLDGMAKALGKIGLISALIVFLILIGTWLYDALSYSCRVVCDDDVCTYVDPQSDWETRPNCECRGYDWKQSKIIANHFVSALSIVVMIIPEGLPLAVTLSLSFAMRQMYKENVLVRHLKACEIMSNCTSICTDKTGTLTENKMTVVQGLINNTEVQVPVKSEVMKTFNSEAVEAIKYNIILNTSDSANYYRKEDNTYSFVGNSTDCALLVFADESFGADYRNQREKMNELITYQIPFSSATKRMVTWVDFDKKPSHDEEDKGHKKSSKKKKSAEDESINSFKKGRKLFVKGAPEFLLPHCLTQFNGENGEITLMTQENKDNVLQFVTSLAQNGLRTLCLAYRDLNKQLPAEGVQELAKKKAQMEKEAKKEANKAGLSLKAYLKQKEQEHDEDEPNGASDEDSCYTFLCVLGLQDPLRPEVPTAIRTCLRAGISVRMVTGDNIHTARYIATQCGILRSYGVCIEGPEFAKKSDDELFENDYIDHIQVLARCSPSDKRRLVHLLITRGEVVAVTGDGTNDVMALKEADVGMAMGIRGTDIAKHASDVVLLDDNFKSIVTTVSWGRCIFDNIRKFLQFQLAISVVAFSVAVVASLSGRGNPIKPIQLLWLNMISDSLAALAFGSERPQAKLLHRKPHGRKQRLINGYMLRMMVFQSVYQTFVLLLLLFLGPSMSWLDIPCAHTRKPTPGLPSECLLDGIPATSRQITEQNTELSSLIFCCFGLLQIPNEILCRKVHGEKNPFSGITKSRLIIYVCLFTISLQAILIVFTGPVFSVTTFPGMSWGAWVTSIVVMLISLPIGMLTVFVPVNRRKLKREKKEAEEKRKKEIHKPSPFLQYGASLDSEDDEKQVPTFHEEVYRVPQVFILGSDMSSEGTVPSRPSLDYPTPYEEELWRKYENGEELPEGVVLPPKRHIKGASMETARVGEMMLNIKEPERHHRRRHHKHHHRRRKESNESEHEQSDSDEKEKKKESEEKEKSSSEEKKEKRKEKKEKRKEKSSAEEKEKSSSEEKAKSSSEEKKEKQKRKEKKTKRKEKSSSEEEKEKLTSEEKKKSSPEEKAKSSSEEKKEKQKRKEKKVKRKEKSSSEEEKEKESSSSSTSD